MTIEEKEEHFLKVHARLLEHRYRYYSKDHPVIDDSEYDYLERYYKFLVAELEVPPPTILDMVDFDFKRADAQLAATRVEANCDGNSLWMNSMKPVWDVLGMPDSLTKPLPARQKADRNLPKLQLKDV